MLQVQVSRHRWGYRLFCPDLKPSGLQVHQGDPDLRGTAQMWAALLLDVQPGQVAVSLVKGPDTDDGGPVDLTGPPGWES